MKRVLALATLMAATNALAIPILVPSRCTHDSLNQWAEGQPVQGTARGRNEWLKVCNPMAYDLSYPDGNEFEASLPNRRVYMTYGIVVPGHATLTFTTNGYVAPTTPPANAASETCIVPAPNKPIGLCTSGCVTPDTPIASGSGEIEIADLEGMQIQEVLVPVQEENGMAASSFKVRSFIKDMIPATQQILKITTKSKGSIQVSKNHPLLNGDHLMKAAEELTVGDALITDSGKADEITSIEEVPYFGKLHNLTVETNKMEESLYVAQGFISGDKKFQDIEVSEKNRGFLRSVAFEMLKK